MGLDIRLPIGLMFLTLGAILGGFGLLADIPMDLHVGGAMLSFGALMTFLAKRATRGQPTPR